MRRFILGIAVSLGIVALCAQAHAPAITNLVTTVGTTVGFTNAFVDGGLQVANGLTIGTTNATSITLSRKQVAALDFPLIDAGTCYSMTQGLTGAVANDPVACTFPSSLDPNLMATCFVSAGNTLTTRLCNMSGSGIDPANATYGSRLLK